MLVLQDFSFNKIEKKDKKEEGLRKKLFRSFSRRRHYVEK